MKHLMTSLALMLALSLSAPLAKAQSERPKISCSKDERKQHSFAACLTFSGMTCSTAMRFVENDSLIKRFAQRVACTTLANSYSSIKPDEADRKLQGLVVAAHLMEDGFDKLGGFWGFAGKLYTMGVASVSQQSLFNSCRKRFEKKCYRNYLKWKGLDADEVMQEEAWEATIDKSTKP